MRIESRPNLGSCIITLSGSSGSCARLVIVGSHSVIQPSMYVHIWGRPSSSRTTSFLVQVQRLMSEFIEIDWLPPSDYDSSLTAFRWTWPHCLCRARIKWLESLIDSAVIMHRWKIHKETKINTLKPSGNSIFAIRDPMLAQTKTPAVKPPPDPHVSCSIEAEGYSAVNSNVTSQWRGFAAATCNNEQER